MKKSLKMIFCDIAGTLCFHNLHNKMNEAKPIDNNLVELKEPITGKYCHVIETPVQDYTVYTDPETIRLLKLIKDRHHLVYITGSRPSTMTVLRNVLPAPHATILESGAVICLDGYDGVDEFWSNQIAGQIKELKMFVSQLKDNGWIINDEGRTSAVRIFPYDNPHLSMDDFSDLEKTIKKEKPHLKTSWNIGGLDIVPQSAGKGNAAKYYISRFGFDASDTIGIGDDINDLDMYDSVETKLVVRGVHQEILEIATKNKWQISENVHFDGINEILKSLL